MKILALILAITVCACANNGNQESSAPATITISVLPDQSSSKLSARYAPLVDYLRASTALDITLSIPSNYEDLLNEFDSGRVHLANFGGLTFIQAEQRSRAEPLVMRDIDLRFTSCYVVNASDVRRSVTDFEGEAFAFGPELSTSGHLMPRHFLSASGVVPERTFSSITYSSAHDKTVAMVRDGTVAIGVANCDIVRSMFANEGRIAEQLRILETTPPYTDYIWAVQPSLNAKVKNLLRDAFLALDPSDPAHRALLQAQGAGGYLPAGRDDLEEVRVAAHEAGLFARKEPD